MEQRVLAKCSVTERCARPFVALVTPVVGWPVASTRASYEFHATVMVLGKNSEVHRGRGNGSACALVEHGPIQARVGGSTGQSVS